MKNRHLKALLRKRGYRCRHGRGDHTIWTHPERPGMRLVLCGADNDDAKPYQVTRAHRHSTRRSRSAIQEQQNKQHPRPKRS